MHHPLNALLLAGLAACLPSCSQPAQDPPEPATPDLAAVAPPPAPIDDGPMPKDEDPTLGDSYNDFPEVPRIEDGLPGDLDEQFGDLAAGAPPSGQPCLTEPPLDALFPLNWSPPLFEWDAGPELDVFELRVRVKNQRNDLVVYTGARSYFMPPDLWRSLAQHSAGFNMTITVRGGTLAGEKLAGPPVLGSSGDVHIAPAVAPGTVVYWTTSGTSSLKAFKLGDTRVETVLVPQFLGDGSRCVGCHAPAPDGKLLFVSKNGLPDSPFSITARLADGSGGGAPGGSVSAAAQVLLSRTNQTLPAFSAAHYSAGDAVVLTTLADASTQGRSELVWTDLHAAAADGSGSGVLRRSGDPAQAATPAFSHDGETVVYTSSEGIIDGRTRGLPTDVYTVPYAARQGGPARALPGASEPAYSEYYPTFSPGDRFIAFNRVAAGANTYHEPSAEIFIVPAGGGTPVRVAGNRPAACSGKSSPGLTNSWPRWAPSATVVDGRRYYWLVFSSTRRGPAPQLFISAVVTEQAGDEERVWKTYPAVYLSSQSPSEGNHTPTWSTEATQ